MFSNLKLGTKIIVGFLAVVALVAVAGIAGYWGIERVGNALYIITDEESPIVDASMEMKIAVADCKMFGDEMKIATAVLATADKSEIDVITKQFKETAAQFDAFVKVILEGGEINGKKFISTDNEKLAQCVKDADKLHNELFSPAFENLTQVGKELLDAKTAAVEAMKKMEAKVDETVKSADDFETVVVNYVQKELNAASVSPEKLASALEKNMPLQNCAMKIKAEILNTRIALEEVAQAVNQDEIAEATVIYTDSVRKTGDLMKAVASGGQIDGVKVFAADNDAIRGSLAKLTETYQVLGPLAKDMIDAQKEMISKAKTANEMVAKLDNAGAQMDELLTQVEELADVEMAQAKNDGKNAKATATWSLIAIVVASVGFGLMIGILLTRSITKVLDKIAATLSEGSEQVAVAAGQVSATSQSLAEGATEQAAGLEETSSSLEEIASMTKQNADNAHQASVLAAQACTAANTGNEAMSKLNDAIKKIQSSSDETASIIKVINEIAFQTNLLALNAAVEAARAGDAGRGFAVVADEVRNLAMRSAEAAKNTESMIADSIKNAKNGVEIAKEVNTILGEIVGGVNKTTDLVGEIAAASQEQAQGIEQVNTAVAQMDKITQQNAANAEESASASEELSAQAESMNGIVNELVTLVCGANNNKSQEQAAQTNATRHSHKLAKLDHLFHHLADGTGGKKEMLSDKAASEKTHDFHSGAKDHDFHKFNS